jgi:hypothetical protein
MVRYEGWDDDENTRFYIKYMNGRPDCFGPIEPEELREVNEKEAA